MKRLILALCMLSMPVMANEIISVKKIEIQQAPIVITVQVERRVSGGITIMILPPVKTIEETLRELNAK